MQFRTSSADFSIRVFPVALGWTGFAAATAKAEKAFGLPHSISTVLTVLGASLLVAFFAQYALKLFFNPAAILDELQPPSGKALASSGACAVIILSGLPTIWPDLRFPLWLSGTVLLVAITAGLGRQWWRSKAFASEGWDLRCLIPVTGIMMVAAQGTALAPSPLLWFFFGTGGLFCLLFLCRFLYDFEFDKSIADEKLPTLFIIVSPPSVALVTSAGLLSDVDRLGEVLFYFAALMAVAAIMIHLSARPARFSPAWWSAPFPLAALTLAGFAFAEHRQAPVLLYVSLGLLGMLAALIAAVTVWSALALKERCEKTTRPGASALMAEDVPEVSWTTPRAGLATDMDQ